MNIKHSQLLFGMGILALIALPPVAFADTAADMARAELALDRQDLTEAAKLFRQIAEQNYFPAQVALGELLHAAQDNEEAFGWFMMAAYQGDAAAAYDLGMMYVSGEGVEQNLVKALYWVKFAAEKNNLVAVQAMIAAYRGGELGLTVDLDQASKWEAKEVPLRAAAKKIADKALADMRAAQKAEFEASVKEDAERKLAAKKAADEAAAKKVDDADEASPTKASEKTKPVKTK